MDNFRTNKIPQDLPSRVGENAKRLEDLLSKVDWKRLGKAALVAHAVLLLFLFSTILVIRLALSIF